LIEEVGAELYVVGWICVKEMLCQGVE
jgi:hypothetical protein